jgi:alginate O-acetyltransferase complex protein AlgI
MTLEKLFLGDYLKKIPYAFQVLTTLFFVMLSRVLFRAEDLHHAGYYFNRLVDGSGVTKAPPLGSVTSGYEVFMVAVAYFLCLYPIIPGVSKALERIRSLSSPFVRETAWATQAIVLLALSAAAMAGTDFSPFIYFQF